MGDIINILLESSLMMGVTVLIYVLFLRRNAGPRFNRVFLLLSLVLILIVPFVDFNIPLPTKVQETEQLVTETVETSAIYTPLKHIASASEGCQNYLNDNLGLKIANTKPLHIFYLVGLVLLLIRLVLGMMKLNILKGEARRHKVGDLQVVVTGNNYQPFLFLNVIVLPREVWEGEFKEGILLHESVHIKQRHTFDLILNELVLVLQWFNPFAWLNKRFMQENHEFLADRSVLDSGMDATAYKQMLLCRVMGTSFDMGNNFNHSFTKRRFSKMNSQDSGKKSTLLSILSIVSVMCAFVFFSSTVNLHANTIDCGDRSAKMDLHQYKASSIEHIRITEIEITEKHTIVHIAPYQGKKPFQISKKAYITPSNNSSKKYYLKKKEGEAKLNKLSHSHEEYILYFPRIDETINTIHFKGNAEENALNIFELALWKKEAFRTQRIYMNEYDSAQVRVIHHPKYAAKTDNMELVKVELGKEFTALEFEGIVEEGRWFEIAKGSCICACDGGENMDMHGSTNLKAGEKVYKPGPISYKLFFSALPEGTKKFNFKETNGGGTLFVYEIEIAE